MSVINTNIKALTSQTAAFNADKAQSTAMQRLSTGLRINSAKDDAAGLAITNRMTSQVRGLAVATRNANDGISMAQTADGALGNVTDILQRMRELAVQSANASNSADNRTAIQSEVSQLKTQIDQIASTTNFNDIKLMDGSAGKVDLQIGVDQGQTMTMSFDSSKTKDIGLGARASLTSTTNIQSGDQSGTASSVLGIKAGDLLVNGVAVGPSLSTSDALSSVGNNYSAISKAAAINAVSAQSGVIATVSGTTAYGSSMDTTTSGTGTITINGYTSSSLTIAAGADASTARGMVVNAINAISASTGVKAIDTGDSTHGVQLVAADGRNIALKQTGSLTSLNTGLTFGTTTTTDNIFVGTFQLSDPSNRPIVLSQSTPTSTSGQTYSIANADLTAGTYNANVAQVVSSARATSTAAPTAGSGAGLLDGTTMQINGVSIGAAISTDDTASYDNGASSLRVASAIATAAAINKSTALTGVKASAQANVIIGSSLANSTGGTLTLNSVAITIGASLTRGQIATAVNQVSGQTGVVASDNGQGLTFVAADGRNITFATSAATADFGIGATATTSTTYAKVALSSDKQFTLSSGSGGNGNLQALGFNAGTFGGADNGLKIAAIDVSTQDGAANAISAIDAALKTVSLNQSKAGAYLNRLDSVVSNLATMNTNITASRSRILDTDYSTETTNLAKSQIISQAATAMLAQANQSAQNVLALLK